MSDFKREWRYIVVKRKHITTEQEIALLNLIHSFDVPEIQAVVVESHWDSYEPTWALVEDEIKRKTNQSEPS